MIHTNLFIRAETGRFIVRHLHLAILVVTHQQLVMCTVVSTAAELQTTRSKQRTAVNIAFVQLRQ